MAKKLSLPLQFEDDCEVLDLSTSPIRSPVPYLFLWDSSGTSSHSHIPFFFFSPPFSLLHFVIQAKVAEELAAATAQVSQLQLELTAHEKKEMDLRKQLSAALQEAERHETQLNKLQAQLAGKTSCACSMWAPLCHSFSSFISHRFFLSSAVSIPAFPRISHKGIKEGYWCTEMSEGYVHPCYSWKESGPNQWMKSSCHRDAFCRSNLLALLSNILKRNQKCSSG